MFIVKTVIIKSFLLEAVKIDENNIYMKIALIEWNITILLQVIIVKFKI